VSDLYSHQGKPLASSHNNNNVSCVTASSGLNEARWGRKTGNQIGDNSIHQRGFSTPSKAERQGATPSNTRRRWHRENRWRATLERRSEQTRTRTHRLYATEAPTKNAKLLTKLSEHGTTIAALFERRNAGTRLTFFEEYSHVVGPPVVHTLHQILNHFGRHYMDSSPTHLPEPDYSPHHAMQYALKNRGHTCIRFEHGCHHPCQFEPV
jgi:hypothetical protein